MKKKTKILSLSAFLILMFLIQLIGWYFTDSSVHSWYLTLKKVSWNPPDWAFSIWSILYLMIAIAGWLIYCKPASKQRSLALAIYSMQLFLNFIWSYLFFYLQSPFLGMVDVFLMFGSIVWVIILFWPISRISSWLLIPYLLWTGFACALNVAIWMLNR